MPRDHRLAEFETIDIDLLRGERFVELSIGSPLRIKIDYIFHIAGWLRDIAVEARAIHTVSLGRTQWGLRLSIHSPFF